MFDVPKVKRNTLTYRENTMPSFHAAVQHGAQFIEFDVQVTKDRVPIVFHDDHVVYRCQGKDEFEKSTIGDLNFEELQAMLSGNGSPYSIFRSKPDPSTNLYKTVPWLCDTESPLPTLAELFEQVPQHISFNIELKLETKYHIAGLTPPSEINRILDAVLPVVARYRPLQERNIMWSSFDPEVIIELKRRQPQFAVYFLTAAGSEILPDPRMNSISRAREFAVKYGLHGIVVDTSQLRLNVDEIQPCIHAGLAIFTYGRANDDMEWVLEQDRLGVTGVIVDDVAHVVSAYLGFQLGNLNST